MKNIITDFGAVGDGVTDDTIAFQDAAASNKPVQATYTTGGYLVSGTSTFGQFSRLIGEPGTKIIHSGSSDVFLLSSSSQLENLIIDSSSATGGKDIVINNAAGDVSDIRLKNIVTKNSFGTVFTNSLSNTFLDFDIKDIKAISPRGNTIYIGNSSGGGLIENIKINYLGSSSPNYAGIQVLNTSGIQGACNINNILIQGSDSQSYPSQHGIVLGAGEHINLSNVVALYMGGNGFLANNTINFHMLNCDFSFGTLDQVLLNSCIYSSMSNVMARGRANGSLSFLVTGTYGFTLNGCTTISLSACRAKSNGAGFYENNSQFIQYAACEGSINAYHGLVSTGTRNISVRTGCQFFGNGVYNVYQTSPQQYSVSCVNNNGVIFNLIGAGAV